MKVKPDIPGRKGSDRSARRQAPRKAKSLDARQAFLAAAKQQGPRDDGRKQRKLAELGAQILATPPARHQVAYLHSAFCRVGLPRSTPEGDVFERSSGNVSLQLEAGTLWNGTQTITPGLPCGTRPRLLLLHLIRTYLHTHNRTIDLGATLRQFLIETLCIEPSGGKRGAGTAFNQQLAALAACRLWIGYGPTSGSAGTRRATGWVSVFEDASVEGAASDSRKPWQGSITISRSFAASLRDSAVPLDIRALRGIQDSALSLDVYAWLAHRLHRLEHPGVLHWASLRGQFGHEYRDKRAFKRNFRKSMHDVLIVYPQAQVRPVFGGYLLTPSPSPVIGMPGSDGAL
ncbi:replication protein RepA [Lysobacter sp. CA199]|uniref:replication protein RepA n=1 Tax=Lysobacter sp. CA199 TaxID=3455608 RepID=UPI003F8D5FFC